MSGVGGIEHHVTDSPIGPLTLGTDGAGLTHLLMQDGKHNPADAAVLGPRVRTPRGVLAAATEQLAQYFARERTVFELPLAPAGDAFAQRVWALLQTIPYGTTSTYGELAQALGDRNLAQAVGSANGHNPIAVVVPCHRVIGADGSLVGYAGGLDRKRFLLALEEPRADAAQTPRLF